MDKVLDYYFSGRWIAWIAVFALGILVAGCAPVNVIGGCEVPSHYDQTKTVGPDLPAGTKSKAFAEAATAERGQHKTDVDDYNGLLGYVKTNCQGGSATAK